MVSRTDGMEAMGRSSRVSIEHRCSHRTCRRITNNLHQPRCPVEVGLSLISHASTAAVQIIGLKIAQNLVVLSQRKFDLQLSLM